jgi:hypothetical protein
MKSALIAVLLLLAPLSLAAELTGISDAPKDIQALAAAIQGKGSDEIRGEIIRRFGAIQRNVGSGIRIEVWHLPEGDLGFHPRVGPTFIDAKTRRHYWLIRTHNPVAVNIWQSYEMVTLPDRANHGSQYWLGNLEFGSDSAYRFVDGGQFLDQRTAQDRNFFLLNPQGTVQVQYTEMITADTLLESLPEDTTVASLIFTSADREQTATFFIASSLQGRRLAFAANKPLSFAMTTGWHSYWQ